VPFGIHAGPERSGMLAIEDLLKRMNEIGASDLIISNGTQPQYRVHGLLEPFGEEALSAADAKRLVHSLLSEQEVAQLRETRYLDFSREVAGLSRFRISIFYQKDALGMAIRIIPFVIPPFHSLGLPDIVLDFAVRPHGLLLVTGPAGSGKSTTLAAMIDHINHTSNLHVICIEDPIEYVHAHLQCTIEQREIGTDARSFQEALRSVFRQSPDVIMIGEMRDLETMQLALTLAETGHLILATLHTQDATHSINRIVDSFPANQQEQVYVQLSMVLLGVISQQLLITRDRNRRVLACEVMNVNNAIRNLIREEEIQQIYSVIQTGRSEGMCTMNDSLQHLVQLGLIDMDLALRRSPRPKELRQQLALRAPPLPAGRRR
jgi:twitching motility protein PilT